MTTMFRTQKKPLKIFSPTFDKQKVVLKQNGEPRMYSPMATLVCRRVKTYSGLCPRVSRPPNEHNASSEIVRCRFSSVGLWKIGRRVERLDQHLGHAPWTLHANVERPSRLCGIFGLVSRRHPCVGVWRWHHQSVETFNRRVFAHHDCAHWPHDLPYHGASAGGDR